MNVELGDYFIHCIYIICGGVVVILNKKEFIDSEKECASMLGMSLSEYQEYRNNLKFVPNKEIKETKQENRTLEMLNYLGIDKTKLKCINND